MRFDPSYLGPQQLLPEDLADEGSRFADVRAEVFKNAYYQVWGAPDEPALPVYEVSLGRVLRGILPLGAPWLFKEAAIRALGSSADLRWAHERRGYRRLLHPNAVCLFGRWKIDRPTPYSGYFREGSEALIVGRYSTCCTEVRRGYNRSLSLVGKLYPTTDTNHPAKLHTANFITQQDIGGERTRFINDALLRNAPNVTPWRRGLGFPILFLTGLAFLRAETEPTIRQLYPIAELGKCANEATNSPQFMQLRAHRSQPRIDGRNLDFRDEVLAQIYDRGDSMPRRTLTFTIEVAEEGRRKGALVQRRVFPKDAWTRIGQIVFEEAVASYNGDFVLHFRHPPWRRDRNNPDTVVPRAMATS